MARRDCPLDDEMIEKIAEVLRDGNFRYVAAEVVGVNPSTLYRWAGHGARDQEAGVDSKYARLLAAMHKAEGESHREDVKLIKKDATPEVRLKFLQLRYPRLYNKNPKAHLDDQMGEDLDDLKTLIKEKLKMLLTGEG